MNGSHAERVGATVRAELRRRKVTQAQLAKVLGLSQMAVSRRLTGSVAFDVNELAATAGYLGVDLASLLPDGERVA